MGKHRDNPDDYMVAPQRETDKDHVSEGLIVTGVIVFGLLVCAGLALLSMMYVGLI